MNFDRTPRPAATETSRIEEIAERLAASKDEYNKLDGAHGRLGNLDLPDLHPGRSHMVYIDAEMGRLQRQIIIHEEALSICQPKTLREILIMLGAAFYRLNAISEYDGDALVVRNEVEREIRILEATFENVIPALEAHAGVTLKHLGLDNYFTPTRSVQELLGDAAKVEADARKS